MVTDDTGWCIYSMESVTVWHISFVDGWGGCNAPSIM
jgi:hypothetical protein